MTINQYRTAVAEAVNYIDRDAYISALSLPEFWGGTESPEDLGQIWDAVHRTVKEIAATAGLSQRKLAERFCIPYRTMENWGSGSRECPLYLRLAMQEALGLFSIK